MPVCSTSDREKEAFVVQITLYVFPIQQSLYQTVFYDLVVLIWSTRPWSTSIGIFKYFSTISSVTGLKWQTVASLPLDLHFLVIETAHLLKCNHKSPVIHWISISLTKCNQNDLRVNWSCKAAALTLMRCTSSNTAKSPCNTVPIPVRFENYALFGCKKFMKILLQWGIHWLCSQLFTVT